MNTIAYRRTQPKTLLNKGTGFLSGYSHTLNPYVGCAFGCSYCYVRKMPVAVSREEDWGSWVEIKENAAELLRKELRREKAKGPVTIFMSSSTDPYQSIEHQEQVTRSLLEVMTEEPPDFLLVQTRSPLVSRDIDLLSQLGDRVRVSVTVETDLEPIRKHFCPSAPPIAARLETLRILKMADIPSQAAIAPVLPSSERFAEVLRPVTDRVCLDDYWMGDGSEGRRTQSLGIDALYRDLGLEQWNTPTAWQTVYERLKQVFHEDQIFLSVSGFEP